MSFSIQTNVNALIAQENLRVNSDFQSRTIQRLTSGYRINSAADDAAGLAMANKFRSDTAELSQGVRNASDGMAQMQIMDGGLSGISGMLDRLKTLATQSASDTFTGDRTTLNSEYQTITKEIDRQASNIGLVSGGSFNSRLSVYIGGGSTSANAQVTVDLSGAANQVDAAGLGLANTSVAAAGTALASNTVLLTNTTANLGGNQNFTFYVQGKSAVAAYTGGVNTGDGATAIKNMNAALAAAGLSQISASIGSDGMLQFSSGVAFSVVAGAGNIATNTSKADYNKGLYAFLHGTAPGVTDSSGATEKVSITNAQGRVDLDLTSVNAADLSTTLATLNTNLNSIGIYAVADSANTGYSLQSGGTFTINKTQDATGGSVFAAAPGSVALTNASPKSSGASASSAISLITAAVKQLGLVQGRVGAGQNQLKYALNLATSQISNFSAAESQLRDADVASEAANLTKAQVLQQASMAAMAQANSAPQAVLALLRG